MTAADRHLLFGLLALQNGFINQGQLVAAFQAWTLDRSKGLVDHLEARGDLTAARRALLEALAEIHLEAYGGDVDRSLAAVSAGKSTREDLAGIGDPEIGATLDRLGATSAPTEDGDTDRTANYSIGTATGAGQRFRVLRPHSRGGLGAVFVALDTELNREVALKQILDHHADDPVSRQRFLLEAEITGGLEHPGIVPVYGLGTYDGGRPYYAMRFIRGDSLKQAIEQFHGDGSEAGDPAGRSLELRRLLRRFTDVCNALDYAHSRGVLHRDIKPGNIIVGKHGETLVVDWGLAKPLGRGEPGQDGGERTLVPSSASGSAETLPGTALGTPAYMSPEQARGELERLGPRSDVYSLGATLYCLLTGRPPFEGEDVGEMLGKVQRGEFARPRQLDPATDKALEAVCLKAMATKPEDRYTSCRALAEDVERWMADEPVSARRDSWADRLARWTRRHRAWAQAVAASLLAVAIIASVAALLVDRARRAEKAARAEATRSLAAERAAKADADANLAQATANLGLARQAVEEYFTRVSQDTLLQRQDAPSVRDLRELRKDLLEVALRYYQTFVDQHREDRALQVELARAYGRVGDITAEIGSKPRALEARRKEMAIWAELAESAPDDGKIQSALGASHFHVGVIERQLGRTAEALASYERALAIAERIAAEHPGVPAQQELGKTLAARGNVLSDLGRHDDAMASYERTLAVYQRLAATNPANPGYQDRLASAYNNIAVAQIKVRHVAEAVAAFERAREIRERVAAARPTVVQYQKNLAMAYKNIGLLNTETNHPAEALAAYERARAIRARLAAENPTVSQLQFEFAATLLEIGIVHRASGHPEEALATYADAGAILTRLVETNPSVTNFQDKLVAVWHDAANVVSELGRYDEALAGYERARALRVRMVAEHPELPELRYNLGAQDNSIGESLFAAGRLDAALVATERARDVLEAVVAANPRVPDYRRELAVSHHIIGVMHLVSGGPDRASPALERAREIRARLATETPAVLQYELDLAETLAAIGSLHARARRLPEALESFEQARAKLAKLAESSPSHATVRRDLAAVHNQIASVRSEVGPRAEARASAERALALLEPLPRPIADELYQLALAHALGAELDGPDPIPTTAEERTRREAHADRAVSLLRRAIAGGYRRLAELEDEPGWRPLRHRPDFQMLLRDLAFPVDPFAR
jgi:serine/threonine-protein kinase